jgi:hypothetical protein
MKLMFSLLLLLLLYLFHAYEIKGNPVENRPVSHLFQSLLTFINGTLYSKVDKL